LRPQNVGVWPFCGSGDPKPTLWYRLFRRSQRPTTWPRVDRLARVLVAEGNTVHRHFIGQALEETDHEVRTVGTVAEAWAADPLRFDLAVVSEQLEDEDGIAFVRELSADPRAPAAVLLVAPSSKIEPADALAAGAVDVVAKGAEMGVALRLALVRAIERRRLLATIADLERRLSQHTRFDPVSGVYTGDYFRELLQREIDRVRRFGGTLALLRIGSPSAAGIERTLGPHVRDSIVRAVGDVLRGDLRVTDLAGCWPDGRFVIALTGTDEFGAQRVAARLGKRLAQFEAELGVSIDLVPEPSVIAAGGADLVAGIGLD
jgi:PleD family two-component response regulator